MDRMGGEMANDVTVRSPSFRTTACSMCMRISPSFSKRLLKLLHTDFFHQHPLQTRGAMINEAASAKIFGFNSVSILLPQALAGVLSVWLPMEQDWSITDW
jgi:hypothetical protein